MIKILAALIVFCLPAAAEISREDLAKALDANPDLVLSALQKADKSKFFEIVVDAQRDYQASKAKEEEAAAEKEVNDAIKNPYKPEITSKTRIRGDKKAPITVVEYSDFQCPYCSRGFQTMEEVREKYGKRLRFVYKHMPLTNIHPLAMPAARWLEAVAIQNPEKAWEFHDKMFHNQDKLGPEFFRATVKELGLDPDKAEKDSTSAAVQTKIDADAAEGQKFGFTGTPGFLINGVPIRGAYPPARFDEIISKLGLAKS